MVNRLDCLETQNEIQLLSLRAKNAHPCKEPCPPFTNNYIGIWQLFLIRMWASTSIQWLVSVCRVLLCPQSRTNLWYICH